MTAFESKDTPTPKRVKCEGDSEVQTTFTTSKGGSDTDNVASFCDAFVNQNAFTTTLSSETVLAQNLQGEVTAQVHPKPYSVGVLEPLFPDALLFQVRQELKSLPFEHKSNDLYEFYQSRDIASSAAFYNLRGLTQLKNVIYSAQFVQFMENMTGIKLNHHTVDLSAHRYPPGGYLLCHDDDIRQGQEGRRIAFILYLVDSDWTAEVDGGALDLFDKDAKDQPGQIVHGIVPRWNRFAFFAVGETSYHQVAEVIGKNERVSISGWFHGLLPQTKPLSSDLLIPRSLGPTPIPLDQFITPEYLRTDNIHVLQESFLDESTMELCNFLIPKVYQQLLQGLVTLSQTKNMVGPANVMRYIRHDHQLDNVTPEHPLHTAQVLQRVFASTEFATLLSQYTGLDSFITCTSEWRSFGPGHYTLLHDSAIEPEGVDVVFSCPLPWQPPQSVTNAQDNDASTPNEPSSWDNSWQGGMHYVADEQTLLTVTPASNTLTVVFRDEGTLRFVKYVNHRTQMTRTELSQTFFET
ncbi:putative component of NuA3 histone acetyltransferase complex [Dispira simplex]|nr:putative component of NuA3 histone acetyltransferase complex [Dispira simplex]